MEINQCNTPQKQKESQKNTWSSQQTQKKHLTEFTTLPRSQPCHSEGTWITVKLWVLPYRAPRDRWATVRSSDKKWSTAEANGKPWKDSCPENPMNSMNRQEDVTQSGRCPITLLGKEQGQLLIAPERMKQLGQSGNNTPAVDVSRGERKVQCCKEQYCTGSWNVRSTKQGKFGMAKQEMVRVNIDILGISELTWMGMGEFNSDHHYIYYCGQESLRRNEGAVIVNKSLKRSTWVYS